MSTATETPGARKPLLWLAVTHPGPRHAGNQAYSGGLLDGLGALGERITLLTQDEGPPIPGVAVEAVPPQRESPRQGQRPPLSLNLRPRALGMASPLPASVWQLAHPAMQAKLAGLLAAPERWQAVVFDQAATGWALAAAKQSGLPLVYIAHNHEAAVRPQVAAQGSPMLKRWIMRRDAAKYARLERALVQAASLVVAITAEDAAAFHEQEGARAVLTVTPGYNGSRLEARMIGEATPRRVVLVGRFEWAAKQQNLVRWADEAVPLLASAGIETQVVGTVPPALQRATARPGLTFAGRVPDLAPYLADARIGLVAEEVGGGFKLKTLDYLFHRVPVAALADNLAGQPEGVIANALLAENPAALARSITSAIDNLEQLNRMQHNAYVAAAAAFDWPQRAARLQAALAALSH